eukprot:TRINITY_DN25108_c0_g1_i2.p1 TRINITY_DN25108_c0_g1~~TRINITY_DN25108_c0_g1_i2.p1  ORF type:complete len:199 (-),score=34.12 TRINITY_DN25108_c0_g1_i2:168-764(-)
MADDARDGTEGAACCVCLTPADRLTPCGHPLCRICQRALRRQICPLCRAELQFGEENSDGERTLRTFGTDAHRLVRRDGQHVQGAWHFQVSYSQDWGEVSRAKLRSLGVSAADFYENVHVVDKLGVPVNLKTWTPESMQFPLRFSAEAPEARPRREASAVTFDQLVELSLAEVEQEAPSPASADGCFSYLLSLCRSSR